MDLRGKLVYIAGSANQDPQVAVDLEYAHGFVSALVHYLLDAGANLLLGELREDRTPKGLSVVFDWTALKAVHEHFGSKRVDATDNQPRVTVVAPVNHHEWIDTAAEQDKRDLWHQLLSKGLIRTYFHEMNPDVSQQIYEERAQIADIVIVLGGGAGTGRVVRQFQNRGKPVIPVPFRLGARNEKEDPGQGLTLAKQAITRPNEFFHIENGSSSPDASEFLRIYNKFESNDPVKLAERIMAIVRAVRAAPQHVFIAHGHSAVWHALKSRLEDLNLRVEEFNQTPVAGYTTLHRIQEMLTSAALAFVVMTAEDEDKAGNKHARRNVIHEAGLMQGRLGFSRTILLLEEGCERFSNIEGLLYIPFGVNRIEDTFDEIRRVLEREGLIAKVA